MNRRFVVRISVSTFLMLLGLGATAALGLWQYSVAHRDDIAREVIAAPATDFSSISQLGAYVPESSYGKLVSLEGALDCARGFVVKPINQKWRVCPLRLSDGTQVAIVLGIDDGSSGPVGDAQLQGRIQPAQDASQLVPTYQPQEFVQSINTDDLVLRWQGDVHDGYVVSTQLSISDKRVSEYSPIPQNGIVTPPVGIELRNLLYAWQWWVFSSFVIFLYVRFVRDELRLRSLNFASNT